jgi:hypothetical protein
MCAALTPVQVYEAKWNETLVAVKVFSQIDEVQQAAGPDAAWTLSNPILCNLQKECGLMASLRHPNVVQFMGVSAKPPALISGECACGRTVTGCLASCSCCLTWGAVFHAQLRLLSWWLQTHACLGICPCSVFFNV